MTTRVNYSGLVIAGTGFVLTRFTVTLALYEDPLRFLLAGIVPLVLGLGLAAFGVALTVADVDARVVRTTAVWCVIGTGTMLGLALLTLLGSTAGETALLASARSQSFLSNFLIGGSVGGTLTGLYASGNRRQRLELRQQANRLEVLNRLLRHEVLNAVTVIKGYAELGDGNDRRRRQVIGQRADDIERVIDEVKYLSQDTRASARSRVVVDLDACLADAVTRIRRDHPDIEVAIQPVESGLSVRATDHLQLVFVHLLETAIDNAPEEDPTVEVRLEPTPTRVRIDIHNAGRGLTDGQRRLLEAGEIEQYDDPTTGFNLNVVRLFVESFRGDIEMTDDGRTITVVVPRERDKAAALEAAPTGLAPVRPATPQLVVTLGAALLAGVAYGWVSESLGGSIAGIGVFYGTADPLVGWITHEFHSVVFGFVFVGLLSLVPQTHRPRLGVSVGVGLGWAVVLWLIAAGLVAPIWLQLLGIPAPIPNISRTLLWSHLAWGAALGVLTSLGFRHVSPRLARAIERRDGRHPGS